MKKNLKILIICLLLSDCSFISKLIAPPAGVACHGYTPEEKSAIHDADAALTYSNPLHSVVKDYERVCSQL
jgi:uncharacterized protein YceK